MNHDVLCALFPDLFRRYKCRGVVLFVVAALLCLMALSLLGAAIIGGLGGRLALKVFGQTLAGGSGVGAVAWICWMAGRAHLYPTEDSTAALRLRAAKGWYDNGLLETALEPHSTKVFVDYARYSIFDLIEVYEHIDRQKYPDNYASLVRHLREQVEVLIDKGVFDRWGRMDAGQRINRAESI